MFRISSLISLFSVRNVVIGGTGILCSGGEGFLFAQETKAEEVHKYKNFEMRILSNEVKADGETDFKGKTSVLSTEERVAFLKEYADYASRYFQDPDLDKKAVKDEEITNLLKSLKPQPSPQVRKVTGLEEGWKCLGFSANSLQKRNEGLRTQQGVMRVHGALKCDGGIREVISLQEVTVPIYEVSWMGKGSGVRWFFGEQELMFPIQKSDVWHDYRIQVNAGKAYLSLDDQRVGVVDIPEVGEGKGIRAKSDEKFEVTETVVVEYPFYESDQEKGIADGEGIVRKQSAIRPYYARVLMDDRFRDEVSNVDWMQKGYDDRLWESVSLPCVQGGFREAGEDMYLRRWVALDTVPERVVLEMESIDPSGMLYVNGAEVCTIDDRDPKKVDITPFVKAGKNLIAVKVDAREVVNLVSHSSFDSAVGWFSGRMKLHLIPGTQIIEESFVHTQSLDSGEKAVQVHRLEWENAADADFEGTLEIRYTPWFPTEGEMIAQKSFPVNMSKNSRCAHEFVMDVVQPKLWSPDSPALYKVEFILKNKDGVAVDDRVVTTGVRTIDQKEGKLLLNGRSVTLIGAQTMGFRPVPHLDYSAKYNRCAPVEMIAGELLAVKNMGGNFLRVHNHSAKDTPDGIGDPRIPEICDQLGMALFWVAPGWIREGDERMIDVRQMGQHIRYLYNFPSILEWEASNHPNQFPKNQGTGRTDDFVRKVVRGILKHDNSRLIAPTTFWSWTDYANDLGTLDRQGKTIQAVPEYTHPLVTRGTQDAVTGYGAEWSVLRNWPSGRSKDAIDNKTRVWMNFEHEESAAQPNWNLATGYPWFKVRSYEEPYEKGSIGRVLTTEEWRESQAWQAFSAYESMKKQLAHGVGVFSWCTIEGGANSGTYEKPLLDPFGHAKLAWYVHKLLTQPVFAGSEDVDVVYGPGDRITPVIYNDGVARTVDMKIVIKKLDGSLIDEHEVREIRLSEGERIKKLDSFVPKFSQKANCVIDYEIEIR